MSRPGKRRPQILIGAVGVGKTAVLVKVVEMLAQSGKIPVVLRLRDLQTDSDFLSVARKRFGEQIDNDIRSAGEADRVWRRLRAQDKIVVLRDDEQEFGTPDAIDRAELRVWLLDEWKDALIEGYEHQDYVLDRPCRRASPATVACSIRSGLWAPHSVQSRDRTASMNVFSTCARIRRWARHARGQSSTRASASNRSCWPGARRRGKSFTTAN